MLRFCFAGPAKDNGKSTVPGAFLCLALALLVGCGDTKTPPTTVPAIAVDLAVTGQTVIKARTAGSEVVVFQEQLHSIFQDGPLRTLGILQSDGRTLRPYAPPAGWSLVDFAVHPSGDISVVLTTFTDVRIVRLDANGTVRSDLLFADSASPGDPYFNYDGGIKNDNALQPVLMHDAARLAPLGESLAVILRTGRNAIVAYRLDPDANGAYQRAWRTLVEPGSSILLLGITSGTFDTFGQLQNHVTIFVDVDANAPDTIAIGVVNAPLRNDTFRAHAEFFNEPIAATNGVLLTRIASADGHRLGSTTVDTHNLAELHAVRAANGGFVMVGRVLTAVLPDGSGWDAFTAFVGRDGAPGQYSVVNVNQGDVLFDIAALPGGRYLALGTTGYTQNPSGASISEAAQPLLAVLNRDGSLAQNLTYTAGARHNQLTTIAPLNGGWLLGGMVNGPGTHSGDGNANLIVADGFLRAGANLPAQ